MSECYSVELNVKFKSKWKFVIKSQEFTDRYGLTTARKLCEYILDGSDRDTPQYEEKKYSLRWSQGFNKPYSWLSTMEHWFKEIGNTLKDGSYLKIYPSSGYIILTVEEGQVKIDTQEEESRPE